MLQPWRQPGASHIAPRCTWQAQSKLPQMTRASKGALLAALSRCFPVRPREPRQMACRAFEQRTICGTETAPFAAADVALSGQKPPEAFVDVASSTGLKNSGKNVNQDCMCLRFDDVTGAWIMVVADGHGRYGHLVASEICKVLPNMLVKARLAC
ncbi:unnamed protein product [Effrenium voratum]|nr:unnamed protein product [Effrenium voratum]